VSVRSVVQVADLPPDIRDMKDAAAEFVDTHILPHESSIGLTGVIPDGIVDELRSLGWYGLTIPTEFGGSGMEPLGYCALLEELARGPKAIWNPVNLTNGVGARFLERYATDEVRDRYLPGMAAGNVLPSIVITEPDAGSDVRAIRTIARPVDDGWVINGTKHFITFANSADCLFVLARTPVDDTNRDSFTIFLVERDNPGFKAVTAQATMAGPPHDHYEVVFDECYVPSAHIIGGQGKGLRTIMATLAEERISMSICAVGSAFRCLELATNYARDRRAFGSAIGDFQAVQYLLAESAAELAAARALAYDLARRLATRRVLPHEAAVVKLFTTEVAGRIADRCLQVFGGAGLMAESPISRIYRDLRVLRIAGGTSEIQRTLIARGLMEEST
jgi:acyl-CoA dehydrogenase